MGQLTRALIVTQGQAEAGRKGLDTRLLEALVLWEESQYKSWPFGYLRKSMTDFPLPAGTQAKPLGAGESGLLTMIQRILNPIWIITSGFETRSKAYIVNMDSGDLDQDERVNNPATNRGIPQRFKVRHILSTVPPYVGVGALSLIPLPVPDKDYLISFDYIELPLTPQSDSTGIPLYTNDQTMKKFVEMMTYKWSNGPSDPDYQSARDELSSMVTNDRMRDGQGHGNNDSIQLDQSVFL